MILAIITAVLAYRKAVENGRNGLLWAVAGVGVFIGAQLLVGLAIGVFLGFGVAFMDWPETVFEKYTLPINIVAIAAALLASWLLLKFLGRQPKQEIAYGSPPPPPDFSGTGSEQPDSTATRHHPVE